MMVYKQFMDLGWDLSLLCLEQCHNQPEYFCYPIGAQHIGYEGSIMYCFLEGYKEMVFAVNLRYTDEYCDVLGIERDEDAEEQQIGVHERPMAQASVCFEWEE